MDHANYRADYYPPRRPHDDLGRNSDLLEPDGDTSRDERRRSDRIAGMIGLGLIVFCIGATSAIMYFKEWIDK